MNKSAVIPAALGSLKRNLGSYAVPDAPAIFRSTGGPLMGTVVQSGLGALAGYGTGKVINWLTDRDTNLPTALMLGGLGLGPALNGMRLRNNWKLNRPWNADEADVNTKTEAERPDFYDTPRPPGGDSSKIAVASFAKQALLGMGQSIPAAQLQQLIYADPNLSPLEKMKMMQVAQEAAQQDGSHISVSTLMNAAADAGIGYLMGSIVSRATNWLMGGISPGTQTGIKMTGLIGGLLRNAGIL